MCLFHKKKKMADKAKANKQLISENERSMDALIILGEQSKDSGIVDELKQIKETIKYLIATDNDKVNDYDHKIRNIIDDLRIILVKNGSELTSQATKLITQLKLTIADRNAHL